MKTPITDKAIAECFQCGPTNEYKVYASVCKELEIEAQRWKTLATKLADAWEKQEKLIK